MSNIFAKKVSIFCKNGVRLDYTHVTELSVYNPMPRMNVDFEPCLAIKGESIDSSGFPYNVIDKIPIKDIEHTFIDWYIPPE